MSGAVRIAEPELRPFFTMKALASYLAISERTVRELVRTGDIPSYKVAGARRIAADDVDLWLAQHRCNGRGAA